ncbi:class I SAM-dependent methyltransferase [Fusobacterium sp. HC1336]|uniref:class I SAM-dependent methyltransferase n=1 Tax=Fusobacterium sp. HC1336 TaxID=3171169 RepID=UPI003F27A2BC
MEINRNLLEYLDGRSFSASYELKIEEKYFPQARIEKILEITKNKKVIHIGCCDHIPLIKEKIKQRTWLHGLLTENCEEVLGVDINKNAIAYIEKELNYKNIINGNILEEKIEKIITKKWDYIVLGEILEHVNNPVDFLKKILKDYSDFIDKIIITVPNIICESRIEKMIKKRSEEINSDHRYWFTPYTLFKIANESGLNECTIYFTDLSFKKNKILKLKRSIEKRLNKKFLKYYFYQFETLILEARLG